MGLSEHNKEKIIIGVNDFISNEKVKNKLKIKKYNPSTRKHEIFIEKKLPPHSK